MDIATAAAANLSETRIRNLPQNTILAIEDIDCGMKGRGDATLGYLLNMLDGIGSNGGGRIIVITTNHVGRLDPALVRPGRIDVAYKIDEAKEDQLVAAYCAYFAESTAERPRVDLEARAFDLTRVPQDIRHEAEQFAALVARHREGVRMSCAVVEGILNRALERDCVAEVTLKCMRQMREMEEEAEKDKCNTLS
jgi:SpoVK/Ycf46/Vps4 family AAA+-type ATPase